VRITGAESLRGAVALVTGGSSGIGAAVSRSLAAAGTRVVLGDVDETRGKEVAAEVGGVFVGCDVRDPDASVRAVGAAEEAFGRLDIAFLNAGVASHDRVPIEEIRGEEYRRLVAINVDGVFYGMQAVVPALRRSGGGAVVATASLAGLVPTPNDPVYALTKHAVVGLVRSVAETVAEAGITVNALCPGFTDTPILGAAVGVFRDADFPLLTAEDVAAVVVRIVTGGGTGQAWPVQPGRESEPYRFRGVPGPRAAGHEGQAPPTGVT
jgi:NAD(P)-dependent dehydrogenase (short-subunit alcohol dehydrogenase family)